MGKIYLTGEINEKMYKKLAKKLDVFADCLVEVKIELNSEGGSAIDAMAIASRIRCYPYDVTVTAVGQCCSAAVVILAAGDIRRMAIETWIMVHEDSWTLDGKVTNLERDVKHFRRLETQWNELLAFYTKTSASKWAELHKNETYLSSTECLELGLVDKVI